MPGHTATHISEMRLARMFKGELGEVYWTISIRNFALALVGIFIPVYMLSKDFSFNQVILFQLVLFGTLGLCSIPAARFSSMVGIKHTITFGTLLGTVYLGSMLYLRNLDQFVYLIAVVGGLGNALFWIPTNALFAKNRHRKHVGQETGMLMVIPKMIGLIAPLIGGLIIYHFGFNYVFVLAGMFLLASSGPLFLSSEHRSHLITNWSKFFNNEYKRFSDIFFFEGLIWIIPVVMFPIYIWELSASYRFMGALSTMSGIVTAMVAIKVGGIFDKTNNLKLTRYAGFAGIFIWGALALVDVSAIVYALSFAVGLFFIFLDLPLYASFCKQLKTARVESMALRDVSLSIGRGIPLMALLLVPDAFKFKIAFAIAAAGSLWFALAKLK